jgi:prepilin-type N-terminal cleavage/methylation domain-containing protein
MFKFKKIAKQRNRQCGFTLLEVLVATILLLTGIVAVAQLVPVAVTASNNSRRDSTASIVAQRQLSAFLEQPLTSLATTDAFGQGNNCALGDPTAPGVTVGSPVVVIGNRPTINFAAGAVANYSFTLAADPEDPYSATFDIRWAVITGGNGASAWSRRFIIGARQINTRNYVLPLTLDAMVQR